MFHTVYNSYEEGPNGRDYIGKHSTNDPDDGYLGSFKDKTFCPSDKINIIYAKTAEGAIWLEIQFQKVFKVVEDPQFANKSYQTSTKFSYSEGCFGEKNGMFGRTGESNPNFGNVYSDETRKRIGADKIGKTIWHNPKTGEVRWFAALPLEEDWVWGLPNATKEKMVQNRKTTNKGRKTFHNPLTGETRMFLDLPGEPWKEGQHPETIKKKADSHTGKKRSPKSIERMKTAQRNRHQGKT
jgi:hypothetical protein